MSVDELTKTERTNTLENWAITDINDGNWNNALVDILKLENLNNEKVMQVQNFIKQLKE